MVFLRDSICSSAFAALSRAFCSSVCCSVSFPIGFGCSARVGSGLSKRALFICFGSGNSKSFIDCCFPVLACLRVSFAALDRLSIGNSASLSFSSVSKPLPAAPLFSNSSCSWHRLWHAEHSIWRRRMPFEFKAPAMPCFIMECWVQFGQETICLAFSPIFASKRSKTRMGSSGPPLLLAGVSPVALDVVKFSDNISLSNNFSFAVY